MKLLFSNYRFQGSVELICFTVTVSLFFMQNAVTENNSLQEFSRIYCKLQLHNLMVFEFKYNDFEKHGKGRKNNINIPSAQEKLQDGKVFSVFIQFHVMRYMTG